METAMGRIDFTRRQYGRQTRRYASDVNRSWLLNPTKLFAPTQQLADMDAGRAGNLGDEWSGSKHAATSRSLS